MVGRCCSCCKRTQPDFLGIDTSIAPLGDASLCATLVHLARVESIPVRDDDALGAIVTSPLLQQLTSFLKSDESAPKRVGLCGLMLPALEDTQLAAAYARGQFTIERNMFASLHCGLGIDTYPIGVDESPERIRNVLETVHRLAVRYRKPLAVRFVSDGIAKVGEMTDFQNAFLQDAVIRPL